MKKLLQNNLLILSFLIWRIILFLIAYIAPFIIKNFKPSFPYFNVYLVNTNLPSWIWSFGNFDGVHYLAIAKNGYAAQYTQAFFPLYPLLIKFFAFNKYFLISGLLISNVSFLIALFFLYKLIKLDYKKKIAFRSILLLLVIPTAYYFGSIYTESLFILLTILSIYFLRKEKLLLAALIGGFVALTRVNGIVLWLLFITEIYNLWKLKQIQFLKPFIYSLLIPLGTTIYMIYSYFSFNNPLYFITAQPAFGASRSTSIVLLPQVLYRYLKILTTVPFQTYTFFTVANELIFTILVLILLIFSFKKVRFSYWLFSAMAVLLPTFTGTLSSMPRYSLVCFLLLPYLVIKLGKIYFPLLIVLAILEAVFLILFSRGYWIA